MLLYVVAVAFFQVVQGENVVSGFEVLEGTSYTKLDSNARRKSVESNLNLVEVNSDVA